MSGKILNPETGRYVKKDGAIGKKLVADRKKRSKKSANQRSLRQAYEKARASARKARDERRKKIAAKYA